MQNDVTIIKKTRDDILKLTNEKLKVAAYCRVSTSLEEQASSFDIQVKYYTEKISNNKKWELADIYADEAITGTRVDKRLGFMRMIEACKRGEIDLILTKSISRFARNTLDTLNYVRILKELNVAVLFEEENINTMSMESELVLTMLSSVAQQEVQNISSHIKKAMNMKARKGEVYGCPKCYGYDYISDTKSLIPNADAKTIKLIYSLFLDGYSIRSIAKKIMSLGIKTPKGNDFWHDSTVRSILTNEKYTGDILLGKTYTIDPISKRRVKNEGQEDKYLIKAHHEAIVSKEDFYKVKEILGSNREIYYNPEQKNRFLTGQYGMSGKVFCGFCGAILTRRTFHSGENYNKVGWKCISLVKGTKNDCKDSKSIDEEAIKQSFVESLRYILDGDNELFEGLLETVKMKANSYDSKKVIRDINSKLIALDNKKENLMDLLLESVINKNEYEKKVASIILQINELNEKKEKVTSINDVSKHLEETIQKFTKKLKDNNLILEYDDALFNSMVYKVIVGGIDKSGKKDPFMVTIIYNANNKTVDTEHEIIEKLFEFECEHKYFSFEKDDLGNLQRKTHRYFHVDVKVRL